MIPIADSSDPPRLIHRVASVLHLHGSGYAPASIAQLTRLDQASVLHLIKRGGRPARQRIALPDLTASETEARQ